MNNQKNKINQIKENEILIFQKDNYDADSPENNSNSINDNSFKHSNKNKSQKLNRKNKNENFKKNEELFIFQKMKEEDESKINRFSNLKDNDLPLEDKLQIENQIYIDNDNESEQIEVLEKILNNFGKEKYQKKFLEYKNKKRKKSQSVNISKNNILNKIKHDIAIINFEQSLNKVYNNNHNHNLIVKGVKVNVNFINNNLINKNRSKKNMLRIENLRKKLFSGVNINPKTRSIPNQKRNDNKIFFNKNENEDYFISCNNFYNKTAQRKKLYNSLFNEKNNIKEIKINNFNINHIYNNFYDTFRNKRINIENENKIILPANKRLKDNNTHIKTNEDESPKYSLNNSNQFFYNVFKNSIKQYPCLHLLQNKVIKMKYDDFSQNKNKIIKEEKGNKTKISLLEKINKQKDFFQKEIDKIIKNK